MATDSFDSLALEVFNFQARNNLVYRLFLRYLGCQPHLVKSLDDIPFLPIEFFKRHTVIVEGAPAKMIFESSGTTGFDISRHHVADIELYKENFRNGFCHFYGPAEDYVILALLPVYLERAHSSLVYMVDQLIRDSGHPESGFYLHNYAELAETLERCLSNGKQVLLLGVTYALLDFAKHFPIKLGNTIIMETGGMKGKRKEITRDEVHHTLKRAFGVKSIHSEYGMTELLSQAYSKGNGRFKTPPWMQVSIYEITDPLQQESPGRQGRIHIIDLANIYSCSFLATGDIGRAWEDGSFEVLGRLDDSDVRGCNLLIDY